MLKAIIFDFDGVLADTEPLHFKMFQRVLHEEGLPLSEQDYYQKYVGLDDNGCFQALLSAHERPAPPETVRRLVERKAVLMLEQIKVSPVVYPGIEDFVKRAAGNYRLSIVSGALRHEVEFILESVGLRSSFEHITAAEDVRNGKPDPEGYLHALQALNRRVAVQASDCLVIEDTIAGIQAAHAAGMRCLAVSTTYPADQLVGADAVASALKGYDLEALERRFWI
ncbi:MAG TPA: HAD family phosphatase [Nitrospirales bacterium]|nr:HAD family phosphatase [Nitrospirales bacterium]